MSTAELDISRFFSREGTEAMARESSFVQRTSPITGFKFLLTFTAGLLNTPEGTLAQLAAFLSAACGTDVSPQALDDRLDGLAAEFMRRCLEKALSMSARPLEHGDGALAGFDHVYVIDSTNFSLHPSLSGTFKGSGGSASSASMRIQLVIDYLEGTVHLEIGDSRLSDTKTLLGIVGERRLDVSGRTLFLSDLGYFKAETFAGMAEGGQYFLSKLMFGMKLCDGAGEVLGLGRLLRSGQDIDMPVKMGPLTCRLVGKRLPEHIVNQRIRKANEVSERSGGITDEYRLFLGYALCITNLPEEYDEKSLFLLYRIRWRVELVFKTWKSILRMHVIRSARPGRVMCEVYGKLILAALSSNFCAAADSRIAARQTHPYADGPAVVSLHRAMRHIMAVAFQWATAIMAGTRRHAEFISSLSRNIARLCLKRGQKDKPTIEQLLAGAPLKKVKSKGN